MKHLDTKLELQVWNSCICLIFKTSVFRKLIPTSCLTKVESELMSQPNMKRSWSFPTTKLCGTKKPIIINKKPWKFARWIKIWQSKNREIHSLNSWMQDCAPLPWISHVHLSAIPGNHWTGTQPTFQSYEIGLNYFINLSAAYFIYTK